MKRLWSERQPLLSLISMCSSPFMSKDSNGGCSKTSSSPLQMSSTLCAQSEAESIVARRPIALLENRRREAPVSLRLTSMYLPQRTMENGVPCRE